MAPPIRVVSGFPRDFRPHSILEPIHGLIRLTDSELHVIGHPLFQRLRKIKQNGLLYLVFPSATHNRFEHSLGALQVADSMLEQIWLNSIVASRKRAIGDFSSHRSNVAIDLSGISPELLQWILRITRLAALVHDLGHGPLSHTFDSFAPFRNDLLQLLQAGVIPELRSGSELLANWERDGVEGSVEFDRVPHEVMSCVFFGHVWHTLRIRGSLGDIPESEAEGVPLSVAAAILGEPSLAGSAVERDQLCWLPLIHDLIASAPADADRMDYLERDSRAIGVSYGLFDRNRVMKSLLCFRQGDEGTGSYRLGIKRSGIPAIENLVQARYELYVQVYYHKTNFAVSKMLDAIALSAQKVQFRLFPEPTSDAVESFGNWKETYCELSDDQFLRILRGFDKRYLNVPKEASQLVNAIESRKLWKRLYESSERITTKLSQELRREFPEHSDDIIWTVVKPKATKDLADGATLLSRKEDGVYAPIPSRDWLQSSLIISSLSKAEANIGRVFAKGAALEATTLRNLTAAARRIGADLERQEYRRQQSLRKLTEDCRREAEKKIDQEINGSSAGALDG